jgi:uncharacterized coiled-coil DUF342 family protein
MSRPTPETDAYITSQSYSPTEHQWRCFARKLERERDEARKDAAQLADRLSGLELRTTEELAKLEQSRDEWAAMCGRYKQERDETQKQLSSIYQWVERNHPDGFIDSLTYLQNLDRVTDNWYDRYDRLEVDACRFVRERDEARKQVDLYRDKLDLSPISWDI